MGVLLPASSISRIARRRLWRTVPDSGWTATLSGGFHGTKWRQLEKGETGKLMACRPPPGYSGGPACKATYVLIRRWPGPSYGETPAELRQRINATRWQGGRVTLRAWARVDGTTPKSRAYLWLEITEPRESGSESVFYEDMEDRPITAPEWQEYRITADVSKAAEALSFGFAFVGTGEAWLDGVSLER